MERRRKEIVREGKEIRCKKRNKEGKAREGKNRVGKKKKRNWKRRGRNKIQENENH